MKDEKVHLIVYRSMSGRLILTKVLDLGSASQEVHLWVLYPLHTLVQVYTWSGFCDLEEKNASTRILFMTEIVSQNKEEDTMEIEFRAFQEEPSFFFKTIFNLRVFTAHTYPKQSCFYSMPFEQCPFDVQKNIESTRAHNLLINTDLQKIERNSLESLHFFSIQANPKEESMCLLAVLKILTLTQCIFDWDTGIPSFNKLFCRTPFAFSFYYGSEWKQKMHDFVRDARHFLICTGFATQPFTHYTCALSGFHSIMQQYKTWLYAEGASRSGIFWPNTLSASTMVQQKQWAVPSQKTSLAYFRQNQHLFTKLSLDSSLFFWADNIGKYQAVRAFLCKKADFSKKQQDASLAVFQMALKYCEKTESIVPLLYNLQNHREQVFRSVFNLFSNTSDSHTGHSFEDARDLDDQDSSFLVCNTIQNLWSQQEVFLQSKLPAHVFFSVQDFVTKGDHSSLMKMHSMANRPSE